MGESKRLAVAIHNPDTGTIDLREYYEIKEGQTPSREELDRALDETLRKYWEERAHAKETKQ